MAFHRGPKIITDGLVLALDAANPKSYPGTGTTWKDLSGGGNNGTLTNGPTFNSTNKGIITFDGSNDYVVFTMTGVNLDSSCSIEGWVRRNSLPTSWKTFFNIKPSSSNVPVFEFRTASTYQNVFANYYNGGDYGTPAATLPTQEWGHAIATYDGGGTIKMYFDGQLVGTKTGVPSFALGSNPRLTIGRAYTDDRNTDISVGLVRVYDISLTSDEVLQNYNATKNRFI